MIEERSAAHDWWTLDAEDLAREIEPFGLRVHHLSMGLVALDPIAAGPRLITREREREISTLP